jgi:hypothetical protein
VSRVCAEGEGEGGDDGVVVFASSLTSSASSSCRRVRDQGEGEGVRDGHRHTVPRCRHRVVVRRRGGDGNGWTRGRTGAPDRCYELRVRAMMGMRTMSVQERLHNAHDCACCMVASARWGGRTEGRTRTVMGTAMGRCISPSESLDNTDQKRQESWVRRQLTKVLLLGVCGDNAHSVTRCNRSVMVLICALIAFRGSTSLTKLKTSVMVVAR